MAKNNNINMRCGEHAARISFLYQAAEQVIDVAPTLAQHYDQVMKVIAQKTPAKLDYTIKRTICKKCKQILVLGKTATYRLKRRKRGKHQKSKGYPTQIIKCQTCETVKSFCSNPNFQLFNKKLEEKKNGKTKRNK